MPSSAAADATRVIAPIPSQRQTSAASWYAGGAGSSWRTCSQSPSERPGIDGMTRRVRGERVHGVWEPRPGADPVVPAVGADQDRVPIGAEVDRLTERLGERGDGRDPRHALDEARREQEQRLLPVAVLAAAPDRRRRCSLRRPRRAARLVPRLSCAAPRSGDPGSTTGVPLAAVRAACQHAVRRRRSPSACARPSPRWAAGMPCRGSARERACPRWSTRASCPLAGAHHDRVTYGRNTRDGGALQGNRAPPGVCRSRRCSADHQDDASATDAAAIKVGSAR